MQYALTLSKKSGYNSFDSNYWKLHGLLSHSVYCCIYFDCMRHAVHSWAPFFSHLQQSLQIRFIGVFAICIYPKRDSFVIGSSATSKVFAKLISHSTLAFNLISLTPWLAAIVAKVAIKQDAIRATQYPIGPNLFPFPPRNDGESISIVCFPFSKESSVLNW